MTSYGDRGPVEWSGSADRSAAPAALLLSGLLTLLIACGTRRPAHALAEANGVRVTTGYAYPSAGRVATAYVVIENVRLQPDTVLAVHAREAGSAEVMTTVGGRMQSLDRLVLPPGGRVRMAPGGTHVMLNDLDRQLRIGDSVRLTLRLARAGAVDVAAPVLPYGEHP